MASRLAPVLLAVGILLIPARVFGQDAPSIEEVRERTEQGLAAAQQYNLGLMYVIGVGGVTEDREEAVRLFRLAADQGNAQGQYGLGLKYASGSGVLQDYVRSHMWANLSAAQGVEDGGRLREALATLMTPEQIAQAQAMATRCLESNYSDCD